MKSHEFFEKLLEKGSIESVKKDNPSLDDSQIKVFFEEAIEKLKNHQDIYEMFVDGASSSNPGKAGIGVVIKKNGVVVDKISEFIGIATNNVAEYSALIRGLKRLKELGVKKVNVFSDSELVVKQLKGIYRVKDKNLKTLYNEVLRLSNKFEYLNIEHIKRDKNSMADTLAKTAISRN
ncbi:ribonuclease HI family protein [Hippea maritima]|uniref:Ribonuclease H n=1 Tax=Hippea maritima (strain ATCC 700847 / DSM 10411 / MH2) TaxID=760142 RepID=F2LX22_HIPMA|nr:ribonuclease HI family protein [Hippea maritima]AEA34206.1 ribonuclease H [Hippea maritima DSM 10411]